MAARGAFCSQRRGNLGCDCSGFAERWKGEGDHDEVPLRAGLSVAILYQYLPNKRALLQAALRRHSDEIAAAVELVCREQEGRTHHQMVTALVTTFLQAKMKGASTSLALNSVRSDVDGAKIVREIAGRFNRAVAAMLTSSSDPLVTDPHLVAFMLQGVVAGVSRSLLECGIPLSASRACARNSSHSAAHI